AHRARRACDRTAATPGCAEEDALRRRVSGGPGSERRRLDGDLHVLPVAGRARTPEETTPTEPEIFAYDRDVAEEGLRTRVVRTEEEAADDTSGLTSARAVVGAGRGVGSETGFGGGLELRDRLGRA